MKSSRDSKAGKIRALTLKLLSDEKVHETREIMDIAVEQGIIQDKNTDVVYNVLFHMKRKGLIVAGPDKAQYVIGDGKASHKCMSEETEISVSKREGGSKVSVLNLDKEKYSLLQPMPGKYSVKTLTVKENGELRMNSALLNHIKVRNVEIFISKDFRTIVLNPAGACTHRFTKAGTTKNREIVTLLKRMKFSFPVSYIIEWNETIGAWEGTMNISNKK